MRAAVLVIAVVVVALTRGLSASTGPIPLNCNRACLEGVMDQFLAAVVAHDPKKAPLSKDIKYTENNQVIDVGDGFWKTAQGLGKYKHYFADPEFGQVAFMGTMMEAGAPLLYSLRLRIELGRITEIETVFFMADPRHQAIASRLVKEIARLGGDISSFVPPAVAERLLAKVGR